MTKEAIKNNGEFETFFINQQNIVSKLRKELKSALSKAQLTDCGTAETERLINELEHSINERDAEIQTLNGNLEHLKEKNGEILMEFNLFKKEFYELETNYDSTLSQIKQENNNLLQRLQEQQNTENYEIQQLSFKCQDLQQKLQKSVNDLSQLNKVHMERLQNFEQVKLNFEQQQTEFEFYKKQVNEQKQLNDERSKLDIDKLTEELRQKNAVIEQCISDKINLEKEKNLVIDELNNKILRIERAFSQPTKAVQPTVAVSHQQQVNNVDNNSNSESSNDNVIIPKGQIRKPLENLSTQHFSNKDNKKPEDNETTGIFKFKRPLLPPTSSQQASVKPKTASNRKRRSQPARQSSAVTMYNEFSLSSSDEDDENDSSYSTFSHQLWRPSKECYVADTDASEGFAKPKRSKK